MLYNTRVKHVEYSGQFLDYETHLHVCSNLYWFTVNFTRYVMYTYTTVVHSAATARTTGNKFLLLTIKVIGFFYKHCTTHRSTSDEAS